MDSLDVRIDSMCKIFTKNFCLLPLLLFDMLQLSRGHNNKHLSEADEGNEGKDEKAKKKKKKVPTSNFCRFAFSLA